MGGRATSLRLKLTLWSLAIFAAVHLIAVACWSVLRAEFDRRALDEELRRHAATFAAEASSAGDKTWTQSDVQTLAKRASSADYFWRYAVVVRDASGNVIAFTHELGTAPIAFSPVPAGAAPEPVLRSFELAAQDGSPVAMRSASVPFVDTRGVARSLELATLVPASRDVPGQIRALAFVSLPLGALAAAITGWVLAGRTVNPIERIARAARLLSPDTAHTGFDVGPGDSEVTRLQRELNDALRRLAEGYRAQEAFLANVAHELRTPISVLLSEAQVLRASPRQALEYETFLDSVEEEMRRLARIVESLLLLSRAERGRELVRHERVALNELVLAAVEGCERAARERNAHLVPQLHLGSDGDLEPECLGDGDLLRAMVENLVRNAIRYSPPDGAVHVELDCSERTAVIRVSDQGPGIPPEYRERVFDRFFRVPGSRPGGTGLGLAIAKGVVELHGGSIAALGEDGGGAVFEVRLPLAATRDPAAVA